MPTLEAILQTLSSLAGFSAITLSLLNLARWRGWVNDQNAPTVAFGINVVGFIVLAGLQLAGAADLVPMIDAKLAAGSVMINAILSIFAMQGLTRVWHAAVKGVKAIGYINTNDPRELPFR